MSSLFLINDIFVLNGTEDGKKLITDQMARIPSRQSLLLLKEHLDETLNLTDEYVSYLNQAFEEHRDERRQETSRTPKRSRKRSNGFVYLMANRRNNFTKIGYSNHPEYRETTLQSEDPDVELIYKTPGNLEDEKRWHINFESKRIRGEWFNLSEADILLFKSQVTIPISTPEEASLARVLAAAVPEDPHDGDSFED